MLMLFKVGISLQKLLFPAISLHGSPCCDGQKCGHFATLLWKCPKGKGGLQDQAMLSLARTSGELDVCSQKNTSSVSISLLVRETREEQELTHCSDCKQLPCSLVKVSQHDVHNKSLAKPGIRMPDNGKQECSSCLERRP